MAYDAGRFIVRNIVDQIDVLNVDRHQIGGYISAHALSSDGKHLVLGFKPPTPRADPDKTQTMTPSVSIPSAFKNILFIVRIFSQIALLSELEIDETIPAL